MRVTITDKCKVWEINDKNGMAEVKFSTSRKANPERAWDKIQIDNKVANNGYIASYRTFVHFVGHAYNKLKDIEVGKTIITNLLSDMNNEPRWDSKLGQKVYPKNDKITVFDFEIDDGNNRKESLDSAPEVEVDDGSESVTTVYASDINVSASDECPF